MTPRSVTRSLVVLHFRAGRQVCSCGCEGTVTPHPTKTSLRARYLHGHNGRRTDAERFWEKVQKSGPNECWTWLGYIGSHGYGMFWRGSRDDDRKTTAHRAAYELLVGPIPDGLHIDHLCENKMCVNPAHLEPVQASVNTERYFGVLTHCRRGHPLSGENLYARPNGRRECRLCTRASWHRRNGKSDEWLEAFYRGEGGRGPYKRRRKA